MDILEIVVQRKITLSTVIVISLDKLFNKRVKYQIIWYSLQRFGPARISKFINTVNYLAEFSCSFSSLVDLKRRYLQRKRKSSRTSFL